MQSEIIQAIARELSAKGIKDAESVAEEIGASLPQVYVESDLRDAFRAGWQERNKYPGLKRRTANTLDNAVLASIGGGRHMSMKLVPDAKKYHGSIWQRSDFRKKLAAPAP